MCLLQLFLPAALTDYSYWTSASTKQPKNSFAAGFKNGTHNRSANNYGQGDCTQPVDLRMSIVKPLGAKWMMNLYDYMKLKPDDIRNGFLHAGVIIQQ